jgi:hypothetical protein
MCSQVYTVSYPELHNVSIVQVLQPKIRGWPTTLYLPPLSNKSIYCNKNFTMAANLSKS